MTKAAEPTPSPSPALHAALLDYFSAPGKYQLGLRQPSLLFASIREILQIAAGRGVADPHPGTGKPAVQEAAAFFLRAGLLYPGADHYAVLGLPPKTDPVELKERYRLLMRLIHPDFATGGPSTWPADAAVRVNRAYEVLSSEVLRRDYDEQLSTAAQRPAASAMAEARRPAVVAQAASDGQRLRVNRKAAWAFAAGVGMLGILILAPRNEPESLIQKAPVPAAGPTQAPDPTTGADLVASAQLPASSLAAIRPDAPVPPASAAPESPAPASTAPAPVPPPRAEAPPPQPVLAAAPALAMPAPQRAAPEPATPAPVRASVAPQPLAVPRASLPPPAPVQPARAWTAPPPPSRPPTAVTLVAPARPPAVAPMAPAPVLLPPPVAANPRPPGTLPSVGEVDKPDPLASPLAVAAPPPPPPPAPARTAPVAAAASSPTLADAQPLLTQLLQMLDTGSGEQLLRLLDGEARMAAPAQALSRHYDQLVRGARPVRLSQVEFKGEPRDDVLLVTGRIRMHTGEPTIGSHGERILVRAEFVSRGGRVMLKGLSGASD